MKEKKGSVYRVVPKEVKNYILRRNRIFRHTFCINNSHWQSGGIIIFLCKYFIIISDILVGTFLYVLFLLLAVILSGLLEKPRRNKDWVTEKSTQKNLCEWYYVTFYCFLWLLPPLLQVTYLLNGPYKYSQYCYGRYSVWWYHE